MRKLRRKEQIAEAARRRMRWYILPDGMWQRCDPRKKPAGALLPKAWLKQDALKRHQEAAGESPSEANVGTESGANPSAEF